MSGFWWAAVLWFGGTVVVLCAFAAFLIWGATFPEPRYHHPPRCDCMRCMDEASRRNHPDD